MANGNLQLIDIGMMRILFRIGLMFFFPGLIMDNQVASYVASARMVHGGTGKAWSIITAGSDSYRSFGCPEMDGPGFLTEYVRAHEIVSGYGYCNPGQDTDSFAYAQKAITIGVKEYLLKPIDYEELKNMAARLAEEIHAKKDEQQEVRDLQKYFNQSVPELRSKFAGIFSMEGSREKVWCRSRRNPLS